MRKLLIAFFGLVFLVIGVAVAWVIWGQQLSTVLDNYRPVEERSEQITSVRYEGNGTGGVLWANEIALSLNDVSPPPSVGSTKEGQLAIAIKGKVFPFGPLPKTAEDSGEVMTTNVPAEDEARLSLRHSILPWPTPLNFNFMTGASPSWRRHSYRLVTWKKPNGPKLEMLWRYQQDFIGNNGWTSPTMVHDEGHTGLVKIEIKP